MCGAPRRALPEYFASLRQQGYMPRAAATLWPVRQVPRDDRHGFIPRQGPVPFFEARAGHPVTYLRTKKTLAAP